MRIYVRKNYKRISQYSFRVSVIRTIPCEQSLLRSKLKVGKEEATLPDLSRKIEGDSVRRG